MVFGILQVSSFPKSPNNTAFTTAVLEELDLKNVSLKAKEKYLYTSLSVTDQQYTSQLYLTLKLLLIQIQYPTLLFVKFMPEIKTSFTWFHIPRVIKHIVFSLSYRNIFLQTISCLFRVKFCHERSTTCCRSQIATLDRRTFTFSLFY